MGIGGLWCNIKKISNMLPPGVLIGLMELLDFFFVKLSSEFSSETYNLISILRELAFIAANVSLLPFLNKLSKMIIDPRLFGGVFIILLDG